MLNTKQIQTNIKNQRLKIKITIQNTKIKNSYTFPCIFAFCILILYLLLLCHFAFLLLPFDFLLGFGALSFEFDLRIEPGLEKQTQDGLICPSCENFLIDSPIFGFLDCQRLLPSRPLCQEL
jgi:hypothetical protein